MRVPDFFRLLLSEKIRANQIRATKYSGDFTEYAAGQFKCAKRTKLSRDWPGFSPATKSSARRQAEAIAH